MPKPLCGAIKAKLHIFRLTTYSQKTIHIWNVSRSCIDMIFISQPYLVMESKVEFSLHFIWYNLIAYTKFNLKTCFPPFYISKL